MSLEQQIPLLGGKSWINISRMETGWTRSKRTVGLACVFVAGLILLGLGSVPWKVPQEIIEKNLRAALQKETAYSLVSFGETRFRAFPWPVLDIDTLKLTKESQSQERVSIEKLRLRLNVGSWLLGNPRLVEMRLTKPIVHLASSEKLNETEAVSTIILNFLRSNDRPSLKNLRIAGAQILLDGKPWLDTLFINMQNVARTDLRLRARAQYNNVPITLRAEIQQSTSPEGRGIAWSFHSPGLSSQFNGRLFGSQSLDADGYSSTNITDGESYARGLGAAPSIARILSKLAIAGDTKINWPLVQIRNAVIRLDQNKIDGSIEFSFDAKPRVSATLGAEEIDLNPRISDWLAEPSASSTRPRQQSTALDWLNNGEADIRFSAERVLVGRSVFDKVALASQLREGRLDVILSDAKLKSGTLRGRSQIRRLDKEIVTRSTLQFDQIDVEAAQELIGISRLKGIATGQISVEAKGTTIDQAIQSNQGKGNISIRNGEFIGLDLERLLTRLDRTTQLISASSVSTRFRILNSNFLLSNGIISLTNSSLSTFGVNAPMEGTIDMRQQTFDLRLRIQPQIAIPRLNDAAIKVTGPWSKPLFTPDMPQSPSRS